MTDIIRYRKKPVEVDTIQWTGDNLQDVQAFVGLTPDCIQDGFQIKPDGTAVVWDKLHATWVGVYTGQHIIRGVRGEFYPIAPDVLADTYEPVQAATA